MVREESKDVPQESNQANPSGNDQDEERLFSPRFKSIAAMAGWDEEALLVASLIVEDTPDRVCKHKKRSDSVLKSPPSTNSRRKRRAQRRSSFSPLVATLNLEEDDASKEESEKKKKNTEQKMVIDEEKKKKGEESPPAVSGFNGAFPCIDKLREELSCAICLEICYEPSTTPCGHSFCKKCLRSAADKCGRKCPKCRQLMSNGRSCTVNTVLWNTIQLLFPQEVEARKTAAGNQQAELQTPVRRTRSSQPPLESSPREVRWRRRAATRQDDESIALAVSLQREDDLSRLVGSNSSSRRRRGTTSQDVEGAAVVAGLQREEDNQLSRLLSNDNTSSRRRRGTPSQDADAALALRLQREEFMETFRRRRSNEQSRQVSLSLARANLRAMASRAINIRTRGQ